MKKSGIPQRKAMAAHGCRASTKGTPQPRDKVEAKYPDIKSAAKAQTSQLGKMPWQGKGGGTGGGGA